MSARDNEERLSNILEALDEHLQESPFSREEWVVLDAERTALLLRAEAAEADNERLRGLLREAYAPVRELLWCLTVWNDHNFTEQTLINKIMNARKTLGLTGTDPVERANSVLDRMEREAVLANAKEGAI